MSELNVTHTFSLFGSLFLDFERDVVFFVVMANTQWTFTVAEVSKFIMNYDSKINKHVNFIQFS